MRVALQRLPGAESVDVSLERAIVDVRFRSGNRVTLAEIRQIIKSNGFNSREAAIVAVGTLTDQSGNMTLQVSGTKMAIQIAADPKAPNTLKDVLNVLRGNPAASFELSGIVQVDASQQEQMMLRAFRMVPR